MGSLTLVAPGRDLGIRRFSRELSHEGDGWPGHRRAEATPSFGRLCPAMTSNGSFAHRLTAASWFPSRRQPIGSDGTALAKTQIDGFPAGTSPSRLPHILIRR